MDAKVSVIVPVFNTEKYLHRCVDSILKQTYESMEIILVNDGSSDSSGKICDGYAEKDHRVRVIHKINGGQASARAEGLQAASGKFIAFVDSDDFIREDCLEVMTALAEKYDADIVQCSIENGRSEKFAERAKSKGERILSAEEAINSFKYRVSFCAKLYKADLFRDFSMPSHLRYEDDAAYYRIAYRTEVICITDQELYYYFQSENSVMRGAKESDYGLISAIYRERIAFFQGLNEPSLVLGTYERLCLIAMLSFMDDIKKRGQADNANWMLDIYKENYKRIWPMRQMSIKNRAMFTLFRIFPKCVSRAVIFLGLR